MPETLYDLLPTLKDADRKHDVRFEYCSAHTDVLVWIIERATGKRLTSALSDRIWSRLGADQDAVYTVDDSGTACSNGGFCVSLKDFGRGSDNGSEWVLQRTANRARVCRRDLLYGQS